MAKYDMKEKCFLCPRRCGADRSQAPGLCGATTELEISAICLHQGEEPPLSGTATDSGASPQKGTATDSGASPQKGTATDSGASPQKGTATDSGASPRRGIVNVFFSHCNLHCIYCQNHQISAARVDPSYVHYHTVSQAADRICALLPQSNGLLGLVTPSHYATHLPALLDAVRQRGFSPTIVYNSSGYESVETLQTLEGLVDIYLPDFKYIDPELAQRYSHAPDYPEVATKALIEMKRQVGTRLKCDAGGIAYRGLIVRHLVLPGHIDNSLAVLNHLSALHPPFSPLHLSLMAQYYPPVPGLPSPIDRPLSPEEYNTVVHRFEELGFDGWLQQPQSKDNYRPDFSQSNNPFN